jgi:hypothetical protein
MQKKLVMRRGTFLQMGNVDGEDVASRQDQWLISSLCGDTLKGLGLGQGSP